MTTKTREKATAPVKLGLAETACLAIRGRLDQAIEGQPTALDQGAARMEILQLGANLLIALSRLDLTPRARWPLCVNAIGLARLVDGRLETMTYWGGQITRGFEDAVYKCFQQIDLLPDPPAAPKDRVVALEPLDRLLAEKVPDHQICLIYSWLDDDGRPDLDKLHLAKKGELTPPAEKIVNAPLTGPARQPHPGLVHAVADRLANQAGLATEEEVDQAMARWANGRF